MEERTRDIKGRLDRLEDDMRELRSEILALNNEMNRRFEALNGRIDQLFALITNQRKT